MAHFCRICKRSRPDEKFSGKGHRIHVCKVCAKMPEKERAAIEQKDEIFGFLNQSRISDRNMRRLRELSASENQQVAELASLVIEVARVKPHKKQRLKVLAREHRELLHALEETGLIDAHYEEPF